MKWIKKTWSWVKAYYEAARINYWGERSLLPGSVQDARFDANEADRTEILRKARFFESNDAIVNRLVDLFEQFTAGATGLQVIPNSSDEKWNQTAAASWQIWCKYPDLVSRQSFGSLQSMMARRWFIDGEIFIHKTESPNTKKPRIRLYESHRCKTPRDLSAQEGKTVVDGVAIDETGRPTGYWIHRDKKDESSDGFDLVPAEFMVHLFEPERPGMYRGLSFLYPVMNDIHDLSDIQLYEKAAAKDAGSITNVVKNASGEADPRIMRRQAVSIASQKADGSTTTKQADSYYETKFGGRTVVLRNDEEIQQFRSERPSVAQQSFWDYLLARICAGTGISKLLVLPFSMQGTVTRSDLDVANTFFRSRSSVLAVAVMDIYNWYMDWARAYDTTLGPPPKDWWKATTRAPRAVNVDTGRNSSAMIGEYQAGLRTMQDICAENGVDWHEQLRQRAEEAAYVNSLLADPKFSGVEADQIFNPTGAQPVKPTTSKATELESQPI